MTALLTALWHICMLRSGPDRLPSSSLLLVLLIAADAVLSWSSSILLQPLLLEPIEEAADQSVTPESSLVVITRVVVGLATNTALIWGILALVEKGARLNQTLSAAFGTDLIITTITALGLALASMLSPPLIGFVFLGTLFWSITVLGFVLHRAMEVSMAVGVMASVFVITFSIAVSQVALGQ